MGKHYSETFKQNAVFLLEELNQKGELRIRDLVITNVRELIKYLDCSSYSLYQWVKNVTPKKSNVRVTPKKKKTSEEKKINDISINVSKEDYKEEGKLVINSEIRYYSLLASIHGVTGYSNMPLQQVKLALGLKFLKESGLVESKLKEALRVK